MVTHFNKSIGVDKPFKVEAQNVGKTTDEVFLTRFNILTVVQIIKERFFLEESVEALFNCPGVAGNCQVNAVEGLEASFESLVTFDLDILLEDSTDYIPND